MDTLSPLDAAFLTAEDADPHVSMAISSVALFDGSPPPQDEFVRAYLARIPLLPRYYQRVHRFPGDLVAPVWVNDPDFDINFHVRRTALPAPGGDAELFRLTARVMGQRLDRDHPLWETWVVEGLAGDRWALISKVHHCMVDGVAGTELYHLLLSTTPDVEEMVDAPPFEVPDGPSELSLLADAGRRLALSPLQPALLAGAAARHPRQFAQRAATSVQGLAALAGAVRPVTPTTLLGEIGAQRRYVAASLSLADVKLVRRRFGVTVNDVALAAVTAGFRALLLARGEDCAAHAVRSLVPTNVRVPGTEGELANRVSCMLVDLPVHVADPVERLRAVHRLVAIAKHRHEAEGGQALVELSGYGPFAAVSLFLRAAFRAPQRNVATVTTNVPGPRAPLYLLGRRMTRLLPFVPIAERLRIGVAILSYCDELAFGVTGDYERGSDVDLLLEAAVADVESLLVAATPLTMSG